MFHRTVNANYTFGACATSFAPAPINCAEAVESEVNMPKGIIISFFGFDFFSKKSFFLIKMRTDIIRILFGKHPKIRNGPLFNFEAFHHE